jgi:hypothetical protein
LAATNKGRKVYICETPQPSDLDQTGYEALTWVQVGNVGSVGETGTNTNVVSYDELDTDVTQKGKGMSNAGDPVIECARNPTDDGQIALRAAALTDYRYAFKFTDDDKPAADYTDTVHYNRGIVSGPIRPNGRNEDFILERFTLGLVQREIVVDPEPQSVPVNTAMPSIIGTAVQVGVTLTAIEGDWTNDPTSFTYQWQHDTSGNGSFANVSVGGTSKTYAPVVGDIADSLRVRVTAVNGAGSSTAANSLGTIPIIAA